MGRRIRDNGGYDKCTSHMHELIKYINLKHVLDSMLYDVISFFLGNTDCSLLFIHLAWEYCLRR